MGKKLRSGFTTGSCSAAAAKAAVKALVTGECQESVTITFPDNSRKTFPLCRCAIDRSNQQVLGFASIVKDAGDDPDVTNGAEICATVRFVKTPRADRDAVVLKNVQISRGQGVGYVTKPGLAAKVGEPAINPVPRQMICQAVREVTDRPVEVVISIPNGEILAEKTLNNRLGIVGGLSILGTTGIVRPVSADAWKATIVASMDVAREAGLTEIVLSTGRTSEKGGQRLLDLREEAYAMMGDYLEFSLKKAAEKEFATIHLCGMWAKIMKAALKIPQTHVRNGALEVSDGADLLESLGASGELLAKLQRANTAREMLTHLEDSGEDELIRTVCLKAREYCEEVSGTQVNVYLIDSSANIIIHV
ncbi:cobalt-precorrin-5B (C(1))-methyltransferase [Desulforhopalus singaporensis]|uniref:Cobalt-precorrin-5B C(1)-methyltransferase n=1 Tax=Desulforhopalus singaporensis TaxID=91360 RepID=A0A1H0NWX5_9BACT|nr:cobalt-precorrin-5B (C(1))-methyltransferase [Desulforhopalus singaporensis]SDO97184.1 cobalt-precorrin-5B (C1)-methyltransferase [Desulforhopalus singaporensis]